jgi:hypothetical protein
MLREARVTLHPSPASRIPFGVPQHPRVRQKWCSIFREHRDAFAIIDTVLS